MTNLRPADTTFRLRENSLLPYQPALKMFFELAGRVFLFHSRDYWSATAVSKVLAHLLLTPLAGNGVKPDSTIRIRCGSTPPQIPTGLDRFDVGDGGVCHTHGETVYLDLDGSLVVIGRSGTPDVDVWIKKRYEFSSQILAQVITQAFAAALRRCGLFLLHGGAVRPLGQDKVVLIAGESGSGKSTLTFQLASCGWGYLSDDVLMIGRAETGIEVRGLRRFFALTADSMATFHLPRASPVGAPSPKHRVAPEDLFPAGQVHSAPPGAFLFPVITHEPCSRLRKLTPYETMARLLRLCPWACYDKPIAGSHLGFLGSLARKTVAFDLFAGNDLLGNAALTADLVSRAYAGDR